MLGGDTIKYPQATPTCESKHSCSAHKHGGGSPSSLILGPGLSRVQGIFHANFPQEPPVLGGPLPGPAGPGQKVILPLCSSQKRGFLGVCLGPLVLRGSCRNQTRGKNRASLDQAQYQPPWQRSSITVAFCQPPFLPSAV